MKTTFPKLRLAKSRIEGKCILLFVCLYHEQQHLEEKHKIIYLALKDIPNFIRAATIKFTFQIRFKNAFYATRSQTCQINIRESVNTFFRNKEYFSEMKILIPVKWLGKELL